MPQPTHAVSGRQAERTVLDRLVESARSEFIAVYGRRRIGKTYLVRHGVPRDKVVFFEVMGRFGGSARDQLKIFSEALSTVFHRGAPLAPPADWHDAFQRLRSAIEGDRRRPKKYVLFFDELPWIDTHRSGCLAALEHFWNAWCTRRTDILLVACGSAASWMLRHLVHARGGLHNRLTQTIRLLPFSLAETHEYFMARAIHLPPRQLAELYMVFGGVPHYLDAVPRGRSVSQIVDEVILAKDGLLRDEYERLFASLFENDEKYERVVRTLGQKKSGLTRQELLAGAGLQSGGGSTTIIRTLQEGGFIDVAQPFGRRKRDQVYRLVDEFLLFHIHWLARRPPKSWLAARRSPGGQAWGGLAFESLCLRHVDALLHALGISGIENHASSWRSREAQVDLVIDRADGVISLCELKFSDEPFVITKAYAAELRRKVAGFRSATGTRRPIHLVFVTVEGLQMNAHARELVDASVTLDALLDPRIFIVR